MLTRFAQRGIEWIDLENPTADEVAAIAEEFSLGSALAQDLLSPTAKPRVDLYPEVAYAVLHFPSSRHTGGASSTQEVDFVIGKGFIITAHYDTIPALYDFSRAFEAESLLRHTESAGFKSGHVFLQLAERLYKSVEDELEALEDTVVGIEKQIFSGREKEMVVAISLASRELLNEKRVLMNHQHILDVLEQVSITTFGEEYGTYLRAVKLFHSRVLTHANALTDTLTELRETNAALLSTRENEIMKNLTIMAFVTFPLSLIAGIFGMSAQHTPIIGMENDFWIILAGMSILTVIFFLYFKFKKWL